MTLSAGTRLGPFEILSALGAGGMGEVYRARDSKLNRDVAIKVLIPAVANDPDQLARFSREAQVLASLNHPNIAHIHGLEESDGVRALVMELVEGPTLADRIATGPIPLAEALPIAKQIAEALEAAHEQGIIHRDLKPANIKVRPDGTVKVLDFGLAKAIDLAGPSSAGAMNSPTISLHATHAGMILGTAAYMAPEQAKGRPVDKRADVWSFGVVLYEMLTGTRAFPGEDVSDTLATVLKFEPDWTRLPADTPPAIHRLLKRCLVKDPKLRLRECGSALVDIHEALSEADPSQSGAPSMVVTPAAIPRRSMLPVLAAAAALAAVAAVVTWAVARNQAPQSPQPTRRFTITLPPSDVLPASLGSLLAISPDGRTLVYRARRGTTSTQLFRRPLDQFEGVAIAGTEGGSEPFFSFDGQWLGFNAEGSLKKVALVGGPPLTVAAVDSFRGANWGSDGRIVFGTQRLMQAGASGGDATELFKIDGPRRTWYPQVLPGGKAVLFTLSELSPDTGELHLLDLDTGAHRTILSTAAAGRVLPTGHLVFVRSGALWAVPFDLGRLEAVGTPVPVVEGVRVEGGGAVQYAVADDGSLAYIPGTAASNERRLMFVGRDGTSETLTVPARDYIELALSPDQTRVAVQIADGANADVWVAEIARGTLTRVTSDAGFDGSPLWSPDGKAVVYASSRDQQWMLHRKAADGTGEAEVLATFAKGIGRVRPYSWSRDGTTLVVEVDSDIGVVPTGGKGQWKPLIRTSAFEGQPAVSPDGRWVAYQSNESGSGEVYLQRFPDLGDRRAVSTGGGHMPTWSRDGSELFYLRGFPPNAVMHVTVRTAPDGRADIGKPEVVTDFRFYSGARTARRYYDVSADGKRLLVLTRGDEGTNTEARQINVVLNWFEELKRLVPLK